MEQKSKKALECINRMRKQTRQLGQTGGNVAVWSADFSEWAAPLVWLFLPRVVRWEDRYLALEQEASAGPVLAFYGWALTISVNFSDFLNEPQIHFEKFTVQQVHFNAILCSFTECMDDDTNKFSSVYMQCDLVVQRIIHKNGLLKLLLNQGER